MPYVHHTFIYRYRFNAYNRSESIYNNHYGGYLGDVSHVTVLHHVVSDGPATNVYDQLQEQEVPVQLLEENVIEAK